jgi:hypothetical protein
VPEAKPGEMVMTRENFTPYERGALCDLRIVEGVGCELFAKLCFDKMAEILRDGPHRYPINPTVRIKSVEVFEHAGNSAIYEG